MLSFNPIEIGFASYLDHPADIPELAYRCAGLVGATFSGSWLPLLSNADRWVRNGAFGPGRKSSFMRIPRRCALAGEAIREGLDIRWRGRYVSTVPCTAPATQPTWLLKTVEFVKFQTFFADSS